MSPKSKVQSPKSAAAVAGGMFRWVTPHHAPRNTHESPSTNHPSPVTRHRSLGFTLIEIMIVVAIMGIVLTMSVPIVYKVWHKAPLRQAVSDIVEVCSHARARAILQGTPTAVVFHPKENRLEVSSAASPPPAAAQGGRTPEYHAAPASGSGLSAQLSSDVIIEELDINMSGIEFNDAETAVVRFYPNGICDEMRMILFDGRDRLGIELEITTGLASVVNDPLREWARR